MRGVLGRGEPVGDGQDIGQRLGQTAGELAGIGGRDGALPVRVDAQDLAPAAREVDHRGGVGVVDELRLLPDLAQRTQPWTAEDTGDRCPHTTDVFAGDDARVDAGQQQRRQRAGVPGVVDRRGVGVEQSGDGVPQPPPVRTAALPLFGFGAGFLEQVGDVCEDRRRAGRSGPAAVHGVRGAVHEQPVPRSARAACAWPGWGRRCQGCRRCRWRRPRCVAGAGRSIPGRRRRRRGRPERSGRCGRSACAPAWSKRGTTAARRRRPSSRAAR
jgi:hypothetical protein